MTRRTFIGLIAAMPIVAMHIHTPLQAESVEVTPALDGVPATVEVVTGFACTFCHGEHIFVQDRNGTVTALELSNLWHTANGRTVLCGQIVKFTVVIR